MASRSISDCVPVLQDAYNKAVVKYKETYPNASQPFLTATYRSNEEQTKLYAQGRTTAGKIVTNAKAGESKHNTNPSKAFDIAFKDSNGSLDWSSTNFKNFATIIKKINSSIVWGGNFKTIKDLPHFEV